MDASYDRYHIMRYKREVYFERTRPTAAQPPLTEAPAVRENIDASVRLLRPPRADGGPRGS